MEMLKFAEGLRKKIIKDQHHFFDIEESEDVEHITNIKHIIFSISAYLESEGTPEDQIKDLSYQLRQFARSEFIEMCISIKYEGEEDGVVTEESEVWFDYIYENGKYPE